MAATATLPRSAGNGAALVVVALDAAIRLLAALENFMNKPQPTVASAVRTKPDQLSVWQLYGMTGTGDSVNPKVREYLQRKLGA